MRTVRRPRVKKNPLKKALTVISILAVFLVIIFFVLKALVTARYPIKFEEHVDKYADQHSLPRSLVYAVIKNESGFNENAVSYVPARGLMQITEDTFDWLKTKISDEKNSDTDYDDMFDPETNIKYGTFFLALLYDELGSYGNALSGYHAGLSAARSWLENAEYSPDGKEITNIPYKNTRTYVNRVIRSEKLYKKLYFSKEEENQIS